MERRCWRALIAGGHVFGKWGLLRVDVPKCWRPPHPGLLPPNCIPRAAVVGPDMTLHSAARRFNAAQLEAGPVRLWAAILHAPIDPSTVKAGSALGLVIHSATSEPSRPSRPTAEPVLAADMVS
jgi:hypothetical protein